MCSSDLPPTGSAAGAQGFISPDLASNGVLKSGYIVNLASDTGAVAVATAAQSCNGIATVSSYFAEAHPQTVGSTGQRSFGTDTRGTIYFNNAGTTITAGMSGASVLQ